MKPNRLNQILFFLLIVVVDATAQITWIEKGATWHYDYTSFWEGKGYEKLAYGTDTVIQGRLCNKITREVYYISNQTLDTIHYRKTPQYIYQSGDTIWLFKNDSFHELYNMTLSVGDTIAFMNFPTLQNNINKIEAVDIVRLNNTDLKQQTIGVYENGAKILTAKIIEKLGMLSDPFNFFWNEFNFKITDIPIYKFKCYEDLFFSSINFSSSDCESLLSSVGVQETSTNQPYLFYPIPCSDKLIVNNANTIFQYKIFSIEGKLIEHGYAYNEIDVSVLTEGIYLILIDDQAPKKIIKMK